MWIEDQPTPEGFLTTLTLGGPKEKETNARPALSEQALRFTQNTTHMYTIIDKSSWVRKDLYTFFQSFDNPTWDLISDVRITRFYDAVKAMDSSFFLSFLHVASGVCNAIPELRCRIDGEGDVRLYDRVHPGSTILYDNGTYGYAYFTYEEDYATFIAAAKEALAEQQEKRNVDPKDDDLARLYFSPIPWVSFSGFRHPFRAKGNISIPMIVFGKHYERDGERWLPVGLTLHHGLADGYHAGLFFNQLQTQLDNPSSPFKRNRS